MEHTDGRVVCLASVMLLNIAVRFWERSGRCLSGHSVTSSAIWCHNPSLWQCGQYSSAVLVVNTFWLLPMWGGGIMHAECWKVLGLLNAEDVVDYCIRWSSICQFVCHVASHGFAVLGPVWGGYSWGKWSRCITSNQGGLDFPYIFDAAIGKLLWPLGPWLVSSVV